MLLREEPLTVAEVDRLKDMGDPDIMQDLVLKIAQIRESCQAFDKRTHDCNPTIHALPAANTPDSHQEKLPDMPDGHPLPPSHTAVERPPASHHRESDSNFAAVALLRRQLDDPIRSLRQAEDELDFMRVAHLRDEGTMVRMTELKQEIKYAETEQLVRLSSPSTVINAHD
jgi:hypothetical protein